MKIRARTGPKGEFSSIHLRSSAKIYIMGVCGTAMSSLAGLLKQRGYTVYGSDKACYPPVSDLLKKLKIKVHLNYDVSNIQDDWDLAIVGNVVTRKWPITQALLQSGRPYLSLPEALNTLVLKPSTNCVMVTGTHGKTTVACLLAWTLYQCGLNPGFMIGGISQNFQTSFYLSNSNWFVLEGDEYDTAFFEKTPKFLHYQASHILLTNIEFDHADIYKDMGEIRQVFRTLIEKKKSTAQWMIGCSTETNPLIKIAQKKALTYGIQAGDYQIVNRQILSHQSHGRQIVSVKNKKNQIVDLDIALMGEHNALNFLAVYGLTQSLNLPKTQVLSAFKSFQGVRRRLQVLGEFNGILLIEDFAHHPTAVRATINSVREMYPQRKILAVFEPRSNTSQTSIFQTAYQQALSLADSVFCMELPPATCPYSKSSHPKNQLFSARTLIQNLKLQNNTPAKYAKTILEMTRIVQLSAKKGDVILVMSNGDFGDIYSLLRDALLSK